MREGAHYGFTEAYRNAVTHPHYEQLEDGEIVRLIELESPMSVVEHLDDGSWTKYPTVLMSSVDVADIDPEIVRPVWSHMGCLRYRIR